MKAFINGKHTKSGRPFYSLMEISAASGLPVYDGGPADVVFNWGGGGKSAPSGAAVLNKNPIFNKYSQAQAMLKHSKFPESIPISYDNVADVDEFPVVRKPHNSYGGHGIYLLRSRRNREERNNVWYQQFIDKVREVRVYFFDGDLCMVEEKFVKDRKKVTWNLYNCLRWERNRELESSSRLANIVASASQAIRVDWGAADVLIDGAGKFWIGEINSRPSCWGGQKPKLKMAVKDGVYQLVENERDDIDLSARMWANRMKQFLRNF
jgi:glutathione synthase/RimK-type ligase-like ATP-grasp enzyme